MAIETLHVRRVAVPGLTADDLEQHSFYELLEDRYGDRDRRAATQTIEPTVTNEEESDALGVPLHSPAFLFERTTRTASGEIVEYVRSIYRGDRYRLVTELAGARRPRQALSAAPLVSTALRPAEELSFSKQIGLGQPSRPRCATLRADDQSGLNQLTAACTALLSPRSESQVVRLGAWRFVNESTDHRRRRDRHRARGCSLVRLGRHGRPDRPASSITVWLQTDAQSAAGRARSAAANAQFQKDHPGVTVNVQYQTWGTHLQKFDATLAGGNAPDVIEMGNTEMTKYMAAGAFQDLTADKSSFPNSSTWLAGPRSLGPSTAASSTASRTTRARASSPIAPTCSRQAGASRCPTSLAQFTAAATKLAAKNGSKKGFSPVYIAGTDWYFAMSFVYDFGGKIATQVSGKWKGTLDVAEGARRPGRVQELLQRRLAGQQDDRRDAPEPVRRLRPGPRRARSSAPAGSAAASATSYKPVTAQFVMPSHTKGQACRASSAAPTSQCRSAATRRSASDWIAALHEHVGEKALQAIGQHPEHDVSLLNPSNVHEKAAQPQLVRADGEELGQRGERQHPPHHARPDPDRQADRSSRRRSRRATTSRSP